MTVLLAVDNNYLRIVQHDKMMCSPKSERNMLIAESRLNNIRSLTLFYDRSTRVLLVETFVNI